MDVKRKSKHALHIWTYLSFLGMEMMGSFSETNLAQFLSGSYKTNSQHLWQEFWVPLKPLLYVQAHVSIILLLLTKLRDTNFIAIRYNFRLCFKMFWTQTNEIIKMITSQTVILLFSRANSFNWSTFSAILLVMNVPSVQHLRKRHTAYKHGKSHTNLCYFHCLQATFNIWKFPYHLSPSFKQNFIQTCCSFKSAIF